MLCRWRRLAAVVDDGGGGSPDRGGSSSVSDRGFLVSRFKKRWVMSRSGWRPFFFLHARALEDPALSAASPRVIMPWSGLQSTNSCGVQRARVMSWKRARTRVRPSKRHRYTCGIERSCTKYKNLHLSFPPSGVADAASSWPLGLGVAVPSASSR